MKIATLARSPIYRACVVVSILVLFTAGCAGRTAEPDTPASAPRPGAPPPGSIAPQPRVTPPQAARPAAPPVPKTPVSPVPTPKAAPLTLDLTSLKERLRGTKAIGIFTKITLKNQVDDLMGHFREHYRGKPTPTMTELRTSFDLLMMKVLSLLQNDDQALASAVVSSREAIWVLLSDPKTFAALQS